MSCKIIDFSGCIGYDADYRYVFDASYRGNYNGIGDDFGSGRGNYVPDSNTFFGDGLGLGSGYGYCCGCGYGDTWGCSKEEYGGFYITDDNFGSSYAYGYGDGYGYHLSQLTFQKMIIV